MNVFEHLIVFSVIAITSLYFSIIILHYKIKIGNEEYALITQKNNLVNRVLNGSTKAWCLNYKKLLNYTNSSTDIKCWIDINENGKMEPNETIDIWRES